MLRWVVVIPLVLALLLSDSVYCQNSKSVQTGGPADTRPPRKPSSETYNKGIADLQEAIRRTDLVLRQNQLDGQRLMTTSILRTLARRTEQTEFGFDIGDIADIVLKTDTAIDLVVAFHNADWSRAIERSAGVIAAALSQQDRRIKAGTKAIDIIADLWESIALTVDRAELLKHKAELESQLARLERRVQSEEGREFIGQLQESLRRSREAYERMTTEHGLSKSNVYGKVLQEASTVSSSLGSQAARGLTIVDPADGISEIAKIPGINPDFIRSLEKQIALLERDDWSSVEQAAMLSKYSDGRYINVFGTGRLTEKSPGRASGTGAPSEGVSDEVQNCPESKKALSSCRKIWQESVQEWRKGMARCRPGDEFYAYCVEIQREGIRGAEAKLRECDSEFESLCRSGW